MTDFQSEQTMTEAGIEPAISSRVVRWSYHYATAQAVILTDHFKFWT